MLERLINDMTQIQHNQLVSFIWNIANDVLVNVYNKGDYRKVILPMIVLRRFDAVLEDTKKEVLAMKERLTAANIIQQDEALCAVAGQAFCNSSPFFKCKPWRYITVPPSRYVIAPLPYSFIPYVFKAVFNGDI